MYLGKYRKTAIEVKDDLSVQPQATRIEVRKLAPVLKNEIDSELVKTIDSELVKVIDNELVKETVFAESK